MRTIILLFINEIVDCYVNMDYDNTNTRFEYHNDTNAKSKRKWGYKLIGFIVVIVALMAISSVLYFSGVVSKRNVDYMASMMKGNVEKCVVPECDTFLPCEAEGLQKADVYYMTKQGTECKICPICIDPEDIVPEDEEDEDDEDTGCPDMMCSNAKCKSAEKSSASYIYFNGKKCWSCSVCLVKDEL